MAVAARCFEAFRSCWLLEQRVFVLEDSFGNEMSQLRSSPEVTLEYACLVLRLSIGAATSLWSDDELYALVIDD